ncbi:MAG: hypothetical protein A3D92_19850 [Bacteroidetes bacterium RIFCSPHIGHO2_02_FULL_44_7]|nr:MAG: hypothetical protein A3D92_19850 [Bacteroidetes bacterium RIFCSPHIGHO2_02_FULL_44_7]
MEDTVHVLKSFIQENILAEKTELDADTPLQDLGVDSFSLVEIVLFIERRYGQLIPDHLMVPDTFRTVRKLATIVDSLKEA